MISVDIYEILSSKPHNPHYLKRYYKFIVGCREKNKNLPVDTYLEQHHICPKALDLFPEYRDLKKFAWNSIHLTAEQHIIAHVILWKAYKGSQSQALECMLGLFNANTNQHLSNRKIPIKTVRSYLARARCDTAKYKGKIHANRASYRDANGSIEYLYTDDPKIAELGLQGINAGTTHTDETKAKMSKAKLVNRKVTLYFLDNTVRVKLFSDKYDKYIAQGWTRHLTDIDLDYIKTLQYSKSSKSLSGRADYMLPDGTYFGKLYKDDPRIENLGLLTHRTENRTNAALENQKLTVVANTGTTWYNNGAVNKKFKSDPGYPWVEGVLYTDAEAVKKARGDGARKARINKKCFNDGKNNFYFLPDEIVPDNLKPGMAPQKQRAITKLNSGYAIWNDGVRTHRVYHGQIPDPNWVKGPLPR
jgi:hypothetical protein